MSLGSLLGELYIRVSDDPAPLLLFGPNKRRKLLRSAGYRLEACTANDADFFLYRGLDKQRIGDQAGADADIAEAKRLNPNVGK